MVSKASDDFPDPDTPVTTVKVLWGMEKSMFFRLWTRAPRTTMLSVDIRKGTAASPAWPQNAQKGRVRRRWRAYGIPLLYGTDRAAFGEAVEDGRRESWPVLVPWSEYECEQSAYPQPCQ